jgi:hypothetical protein
MESVMFSVKASRAWTAYGRNLERERDIPKQAARPSEPENILCESQFYPAEVLQSIA